LQRAARLAGKAPVTNYEKSLLRTDRKSTIDRASEEFGHGGTSVFEAIDVWERRGDGLVRYRCFRSLVDGTFWVQSADHYRKGMRAAETEALDRQFLELLSEGGPAERGGSAPTLADAIDRFRRSFC
jgi:hypothetical protein